MHLFYDTTFVQTVERTANGMEDVERLKLAWSFVRGA